MNMAELERGIQTDYALDRIIALQQRIEVLQRAADAHPASVTKSRIEKQIGRLRVELVTHAHSLPER